MAFSLAISNPLNEIDMKRILARIKMGTQEWAKREKNCMLGCKHNCLYCYAKRMIVRFGNTTYESWGSPKIKWQNIRKHFTKITRAGAQAYDVMFPTSHDIFPNEGEDPETQYYTACCTFLKHLLEAGNSVLITSKPHADVIRQLTEDLNQYRDQLAFRFTIGSQYDHTLKLFEPDAPSLQERIKSLMIAKSRGFATTVSVEPLLTNDPIDLVNQLDCILPPPDLVKDVGTIWIGFLKTQYIPTSLRVGEIRDLLKTFSRFQTFEQFYPIYETLYDHPRIRWKESITKMMIRRNIAVKGLTDRYLVPTEI